LTDAEPRSNRLAGESSPYLRLHRHNPVDWYPWGAEALDLARSTDRPIFLSVGYSTCYWCHVMERESFSDAAVAELMNRQFVCIKVDREERPEIDDIYMVATQILAGQGGWPNSVFLTPELRPFYAGTYFPPTDRQGMPAFTKVLRGLAEAWEGRRDDVLQQAAATCETMRKFIEERGQPAADVPDPEIVERALEGLTERYDVVAGGFSPAPKFPSPANLFLLQEVAPARPQAASMLEHTLDEMARGGIHDQLAGGFHRYATDRHWRVPHFEKMLYDNGLLLEVYARECERTGDPDVARVTRRTADFLNREMSAPDGGLWSAIDAETDGFEGAYYVWGERQLRDILGAEEFLYLGPLLGFAGPPFFEGGNYVLHSPRPIADLAAKRHTTPERLLAEIDTVRSTLLEVRNRRPRPLTDEKILTDWNGMAIGGLALAGRAIADRAFVARAVAAADFVLAAHRPPEGPLLHTSRAGLEPIAAFLGDYVFLVRGLLALHEVEGGERWLRIAAELTREQGDRLGAEAGGYYLAAEAPDLLFRGRELFDGALPAANGVAVLNLLTLAERTGDKVWRRLAESSLRAFGALMAQAPEGTRTLALALHRYHGER